MKLLIMSTARGEPQIDYQKSILLIQEEHIKELEALASKRVTAAAEKDKKQLDK